MMSKFDERCCWKHCRRPGVLTWLGYQLCAKHWSKLCELTENQGWSNCDVIRRHLKSRSAA